MKQLLAGTILLFVVGVAGFLYRNTVERPGVFAPDCALETWTCPDGSAVSRSGPTCSFSACAAPNVFLSAASITFLPPEGYSVAEPRTGELARYTKLPIGGSVPQVIAITQYAIGDRSADETMLAESRFQPADEIAETLDERFVQVEIGDHQFYEVTTERFEGLVHTLYYLVRANDVIRFEITEHQVGEEWMSSKPAREFPEHQVLWRVLETLQAEGV